MERLIAFSTALLVGLLRAGVLALMWTWFVVPLGVPRITVLQAFGLSTIVYLYSSRALLKEGEEFNPSHAVVMLGLFLLLGYSAHLVDGVL